MQEFAKYFMRIAPSIRQETMDIIRQTLLKGKRMTVPLLGRDVEVYLHRVKADKALPVVFEMHGGGLVLGDAAKDDNLRQTLCEAAGVHVVGINYRKAPENPYPAAVNDVCDTMQWFAAHAEEYGMDSERFALLGFSGGATLAAAAALRLQGQQKFGLKCQLLHYPYLDAVTEPAEKPCFEVGLPVEVMQAFTELYSTPEQRANPEVSPVCAPKELLQNTPPAGIWLAQQDSLQQEGRRYARQLAEAGVQVYVTVVPDTHHGYVEDHYNRPCFESSAEDTRSKLNPDFGRHAEEAMVETVNILKKHLDM